MSERGNAALRDARVILIPLSFKGAPNDAWRLARARWLWQYGGRQGRKVARDELADINALRALYAWEAGKDEEEARLPLGVLRDRVDDFSALTGGHDE